ncbi:hypothetical protein D0T12_25805 [Actinomadura spongiicola]|uniref:Uncharacterized protein n=1 Tax=Actinomadura spongiicola TaxID=2303421 RepID=A0A372GCI9_9ACTN|nr:hypothetical protein D0T12_25805 [Actinomadura spongiicola]
MAPDTAGWVTSLFSSSSGSYLYGSGISIGSCEGFEQWTMHIALQPWYRRLIDMPYLIVIPAFLIWMVTRWRAVGWVAAGTLGPVMACELVLLGYDVARSDGACADLWLSPFIGMQITGWTYGLAPVLLILASTYRPGRRAIRTVAATTVITLILGVAGDMPRPRTVLATPDDCRQAIRAPQIDLEALRSEVGNLSAHQRRLAFICSSRAFPGGHFVPGGSPSDAVLLNVGRRACQGDEQPPDRELARLGVRSPSLDQLVYLCPEKVIPQLRKLEQERAQRDAEYRREQAKAKAYCKRNLPKGPRPVRQVTELGHGGESGSYFIGTGDDGPSFDKVIDDGLIAAVGGTVTVLTGTEGNLCLTVRVYRKAPPLTLKGWEKVVEVGFDSPDGKTTVGSYSGETDLPPLTASGPGPYRLRLHVRGHGAPEAFFPEMPAEHHLIVVYPGKSKKRKDHK